MHFLMTGFLVGLGYVGGKLDKAIDEWLGLFVIVLALLAATWFGVGEDFQEWLVATNPSNR